MTYALTTTHPNSFFKITHNRTSYNCPYAGDSDIVSSATVKWVDSTSGSRNPKWKSQVDTHVNATTGYNLTKTRIRCSPGLIVFADKYLCIAGNPGKYTDRYHQYYGTITYEPLSDSFSAPGSVSSTVINEAAAGFYNKANSVLTLVQGGPILGELRETIHLLRHPLAGIRGLLKAYSKRCLQIKKSAKRNGTSPGKVLKAFRESWLEAVFGWLPLHQDISDIVKYLQVHRDRLRQEYVKVSYKAVKDTLVHSQTYISGVPGVSMAVTRHQILRTSSRQYGEVRLAVGDPYIGQTQRDLGLVPSQFVPTLWEILPWSFVADYFTNIGKVITAFSVPSSSIAWVGRSDLSKRVTTLSAVPTAGATGNCGETTIEIINFTRSVPSNSGLPSFEWDPFLGIRRYVNITALLDGLRERHSR